MIAELEHDEELQALMAKPFTPGAYYDDDGDCIEFLAENSAFNARRLDDWVTVYLAEDDGRLVDCLIKRVQRLLREKPALQEIVIRQDNLMRLDYFFVVAAAQSQDRELVHVYNELKRATDGIEVALPCAV